MREIKREQGVPRKIVENHSDLHRVMNKMKIGLYFRNIVNNQMTIVDYLTIKMSQLEIPLPKKDANKNKNPNSVKIPIIMGVIIIN